MRDEDAPDAGPSWRRRRTSWFAGPLTRPYAVEVARGTAGGGELDVVVATPADPTMAAVLDAILPAVGPDLRSVTLTRPVSGPDGDDAAIEYTAQDLSAASLFLSGVDPRLVVLADATPDKLRQFVLDQGAGLVIVMDRPAVAAN